MRIIYLLLVLGAIGFMMIRYSDRLGQLGTLVGEEKGKASTLIDRTKNTLRGIEERQTEALGESKRRAER